MKRIKTELGRGRDFYEQFAEHNKEVAGYLDVEKTNFQTAVMVTTVGKTDETSKSTFIQTDIILGDIDPEMNLTQSIDIAQDDDVRRSIPVF